MSVAFSDWCSVCAGGGAIDGIHHDFPGGRVGLRRIDGRLAIDFPGGSVWFESAKITHTKMVGGNRRLGINDWSTDYQVPDWSGDVLTCEDEEDFDFGLMLANIRGDESRQSRLFI